MKQKLQWRPALVAAFVAVILFVWGSEVMDFPHYLLGGPATPINWRESITESVFAIIAWMVSWRYIAHYEDQWYRSLRELEHIASFDDLTGVLNRREFMARATDEFERARRFNRPLTFVMADLDHFKETNDAHGHSAGDKVLRRFAQVASGAIRQQDIFGRLGGDEFGIVFVEADKGKAAAVCKRILNGWHKSALRADDGKPITTGLSFGVCSRSKKYNALDDLIRAADATLYNAKRKGGDRVEIT